MVWRLPAGLGKVMLNFLGKVRLGKATFIHKYCHNLQIVSQGPLKFSCANFRSEHVESSTILHQIQR
jgi:hypothetical protein